MTHLSAVLLQPLCRSGLYLGASETQSLTRLLSGALLLMVGWVEEEEQEEEGGEGRAEGDGCSEWCDIASVTRTLS